MKIWLVSGHEYEGYNVLSVWQTEEEARAEWVRLTAYATYFTYGVSYVEVEIGVPHSVESHNWGGTWQIRLSNHLGPRTTPYSGERAPGEYDEGMTWIVRGYTEHTVRCLANELYEMHVAKKGNEPC